MLSLAAAGAGLASPAFAAEEEVRIGVITPLTGEFTTTGQETAGAVKVFLAEHGDKVAGKKIKVIIKDDGGKPDVSKRLAQELVINERVSFLMGMGITPIAFAVAPIATQAKVPLIVTSAATSTIPKASPYIVRTSFAVTQIATVLGTYIATHGIKTLVTLVSDYAPGIDYEKSLTASMEAAGGKVIGALRVPLSNTDFSPYLQRVAAMKPDGLFVFVPSGLGAVLMRQFVDRGLDKSGIKFIATGDVLDDELIDQIGKVSLGIVSAYHYSDAHPSALNKEFTSDFVKMNHMRANMMGVGAYDGMALIYKALAKTKGDTNGAKLVSAMEGMKWESPRGPVEIDPKTRDLIQNVYLRKVEFVNGHYENVEFRTYHMVKNPSLG